jgi:hypothetical protein
VKHQNELTTRVLKLAVGRTFWGLDERTHLDANPWSEGLFTLLALSKGYMLENMVIYALLLLKIPKVVKSICDMGSDLGTSELFIIQILAPTASPNDSRG